MRNNIVPRSPPFFLDRRDVDDAGFLVAENLFMWGRVLRRTGRGSSSREGLYIRLGLFRRAPGDL